MIASGKSKKEATRVGIVNCCDMTRGGYPAYTASAWGVGLSHEMMKSREWRLYSWSNATCVMPVCEALSSRRGRRPHQAHKDRVGTWDILRLTSDENVVVRVGSEEP